MDNICFMKTPFDAVLKITDDGENIRSISYVMNACGCCLGSLASPLGREAKRQLSEYFNGMRKSFDLPLKPDGTEFQRKVWSILCDIPYGETVSYRYIAKLAGIPAGSRAVGQANSRNPIPVVIPCHRVISSDGSPGGYSPDLKYKLALLEIEGVLFAKHK